MMNPVIKNQGVKFLDENGSFSFKTDHCNAVMIQNAGTDDARLNGNWSFPAGAVLMLGSQTDTNMYADEITVEFMNEAGATKRVEAWPLITLNCNCSSCKK